MPLCSVCSHTKRVAIDLAIASGSASHRAVALQYGLNPRAVSRHVANHLEMKAIRTPSSIAKDVVQAVKERQAQERRQVVSVWEERLNTTYTDVASAYSKAMDDPEGIDAAAKFAMVRARLCDTGLRADGVLAGGGETRVTVKVEQLIVLPTPQPQPKRLELTEAIDVTPTETE